MLKKVNGIFNETSENSIFTFNPFSWIGVEEEINFLILMIHWKRHIKNINLN